MNAWFKKLLPHLLAVIVFLGIAVIYCRPALEGKVVSQHDITQWKGAMQQSLEYKSRMANSRCGQTACSAVCPLSRSDFPAIILYPLMPI
jgi:predicted Zn-dependent protease